MGKGDGCSLSSSCGLRYRAASFRASDTCFRALEPVPLSRTRHELCGRSTLHGSAVRHGVGPGDGDRIF